VSEQAPAYVPNLDQAALEKIAAEHSTGDPRAHLSDPVLYRAYYDWATIQCGLCWLDPNDPRAVWALEHLGPTDDVIDLGAHKLDLTVYLAQKTKGRVVAVDISGEALRWGKAARPGCERIEIWEGDACAVPYADSSFDVAVLTEILEHVPDEQALLREAERVVKPGGRIVISVPANAAAWDAQGDRDEKERGGFFLDAHVREFVPARALKGKADLETRYSRMMMGKFGDELGCRLAAWRCVK
jgi:SAM-dependent methyltransferase